MDVEQLTLNALTFVLVCIAISWVSCVILQRPSFFTCAQSQRGQENLNIHITQSSKAALNHATKARKILADFDVKRQDYSSQIVNALGHESTSRAANLWVAAQQGNLSVLALCGSRLETEVEDEVSDFHIVSGCHHLWA